MASHYFLQNESLTSKHRSTTHKSASHCSKRMSSPPWILTIWWTEKTDDLTCSTIGEFEGSSKASLAIRELPYGLKLI